jgi:uncharacterized protein YeaO (DUF488 family)
MFDQNEFGEFLDIYKNELMETDNMLKESRTNYRVKKLVAFYGLKDKETFQRFLNNTIEKN